MRVRLIHWNAGEARSRVAELRALGFDACWEAVEGGPGLKRFDLDQPDVFVIDLSRSPSKGRDVGVFLRSRKATRHVPLVFTGGEREQVERLRLLLPDARYTGWEEVAGAVRFATAWPLEAPAKPGTMDAYRGRPLAAKLGIKAGTEVLLLGAPEDFSLGPLPEGVREVRHSACAARVLLFVRSLKDLNRHFENAAGCADRNTGLWVLWPKKGSGVQTDLSAAAVRKYGLDAGWVDFKICAVDQTWSGLQFAKRTADPPERARRTAV